ncbi:hypothetical protein [Erwinia psidii]|uniref:Uncharacterized protein n=1 Tax=Erwinia psidii TaxID=69224 RepID=A0A3N6SCY8_9GAMM|nr:hypothetical protein [Erwinia psidii]MCX8956290.1 hypothetical protein [Erwinia psidii]MCX8959950.1 hypothetical protein [Erwinia psidii]MCX8963496.1 hypothetical protein [Erwinia psidii]RQM39290.1 hypothetical protein EB241_05945 [Erwinia psidii]
MNTFIICHQNLPCYQVPPDANIVWLGNSMPENPQGLNIIPGYEFIDNAQALHQQLSGAIGPMVIRNIVQKMNLTDGNITIWQYRKFVTREKYGTPSVNYGGTHDVGTEEVSQHPIIPQLAEGREYIASTPMQLGNLYQQYANFHHVSDLLKYTALAVDLGVISEQDSFLFLNCAHLIIGGIELGTYPVSWWQSAFGRLQSVSLMFIEKFTPFNQTDPYQKRAVAFCQERLGSYLLLKELSATHNNNLPVGLFGVVHTVTENGAYTRGT